MLNDRSIQPKARSQGPPVCLLTTVHPERSLSLGLAQHLGEELPELTFVLEAPASRELQAIWVCGYEPGLAQMVAKLRREHPEAVLVVTGRGPVEDWNDEVLVAGADFACAWPLPFRRLGKLLTRSRQGRTAIDGSTVLRAE